MQTALEPVHLSHARGAYLYTKENKKIFDAISSWWLVTHGHSDPRITKAITDQSQKLSQVVFANFIYDSANEFMTEFKNFLPSQLDHAFFSDNGSTAVEVAMKMAYQSCKQNHQPERKEFIAFEKAYHGDTCGAMSVSADGTFTQAYSQLKFPILRAQQGLHLSDPLENWVDDFNRLVQQKGHTVCAVIIEPLLQGAGGMIAWPIEALNKICSLAREHDIKIIFDEVMTGFGRTGTLFAFEQTDHNPDFLCLSKGLTAGVLPMGLTVTTKTVFDHFLSSSPDQMLFHGHSFTGNALSCAAALANLKIFGQSQTLKNIDGLRKAHLKGLNQDFPFVRETRVVGSVGILELNLNQNYAGDFSRRFHLEMLKNNIYLRTLGSTVYAMPPYCSTPDEIEHLWSTINQTLHHICA